MAMRDSGEPEEEPRRDCLGFARRRVLGAMLDPLAVDPDETAPRPFRPIASSTAVALVALGTTAVVGLFHPCAPDGWRRGLISDSEGGRFVIVDGRLHPVLNLASARLILGHDARKADVPDADLDALKDSLGPVVGIPGAPERMPRADRLDAKGWSLCSASGDRTVVEVGYPAPDGVLAVPSAVLVQDETHQQYVVTGGLKYKVQDRNVLVAFGAPTLKARPVKASWLSGIPSGDPLGVPSVAGTFGAVVKRALPAGFDRIGMFGKTVSADGTTAYYLVTGDGLASVSATTYELFQRDPRLTKLKFTERLLAQSLITQDMLAPASVGLSWPAEPPKFDAAWQDPAKSVLCETSDGTADEDGRPHLALSAAPSLPHPSSDVTASGPGLADAVSVLPGHGVIAHGESGLSLVTDAGTRYALAGGQGGATAVSQLGYDDVIPVAVPPSWLALLPAGPVLDPAKASQPSS